MALPAHQQAAVQAQLIAYHEPFKRSYRRWPVLAPPITSLGSPPWRELLRALFPKQPLSRIAQTLGVSVWSMCDWFTGCCPIPRHILGRLTDYDARETFERINRWKMREHRRIEAEAAVMRAQAEQAATALRMLVAADARMTGVHGKPRRVMSVAQAANAKRLGERRRAEVRAMREARGEGDWLAPEDGNGSK